MIAAFVASPALIGHFCYLTSPSIETILIAVIPFALGVAVFVARRLRVRLLILVLAPVLNFGLTMIYHEWLHMDVFPGALLSKEAREKRTAVIEQDQLSWRACESAEQGGGQETPAGPE